MDQSQEQQPKKCFCARCFLPIEPEDKVDVEGQNFHRLCSTCCICRTIPTSLKMFYGHVFCNECFKTHVLNRFKGETPRMHSNSWWMQWAPGAKPMGQESKEKDGGNEEPTADPPKCPKEEPAKKCICARCLQVVDEDNKIEIGGQCFHSQCARCYFCQCLPTTNVKIYYGQVFCEECFHKHVLNRNKDTPAEFFKNCFEQWQNSPQFADNMKEFMSSNKENTPFIYMTQGSIPPFCRCGKCGNGPHHAQECMHANEPRKSATPATLSSIEDESVGTWDLSFENRTGSDLSCNESANQETSIVASAAEKIEKLTKYLQESPESEKRLKKWKNFIVCDKFSMDSSKPSFCGWIDLRDPKIKSNLNCPRCLWQCGPIFVNSEYFQKVCCGVNSTFE